MRQAQAGPCWPAGQRLSNTPNIYNIWQSKQLYIIISLNSEGAFLYIFMTILQPNNHELLLLGKD